MQGASTKGGVCLLLAAHFTKVRLKLQGPVPIAFLHWPLHVYFSSLNILDTMKM